MLREYVLSTCGKIDNFKRESEEERARERASEEREEERERRESEEHCMAFGGNFLHNLNIGMQLRCYACFIHADEREEEGSKGVEERGGGE